ncbi:MAG: endospore germination permease [Clostridiaceae bacterium]
MNNKKITKNQMTLLLVGMMIGTETIYIPNLMVRYGNQTGWMCLILGAMYPIYIVYVANIMCKNYPNENILKLSKRFLGKFLGSIFNFIFLVEFVFYTTIRCAELSNLIRVYIVYFLKPNVIFFVVVLVAAYSSYLGLHVISRVNEVILFFSIPMFLVPLVALKRGSLLNLSPVFGASVGEFAYCTYIASNLFYGIELIFLIYPYLNKKTDLKKSGLYSVLITVVIFVWFTFATIYYLGIDIIPKYLWAFTSVTKALRLTTVKNFTFIFMFFWSIIIIQNISNNYHAIVLILSEFISKYKKKIISLIIFPVIACLPYIYGNEVRVREMKSKLVFVINAFNIIYTMIIVIAIYIKRGRKDEK